MVTLNRSVEPSIIVLEGTRERHWLSLLKRWTGKSVVRCFLGGTAEWNASLLSKMSVLLRCESYDRVDASERCTC